MASTFYSNEWTAQFITSPPTFQEGRDMSGKLRVTRVTETFGTDHDDGDIVYLCKLPKGAKVLAALSYLITDGSCTQGAVDIGDSSDDDRYASALSLATAGKVAFDELVTGDGYVIGTATDDDIIIATVETADVDVATVVVFTIVWAVE